MATTDTNGTSLDGVVLVDKPAGITSHDVVSQFRRVFRTRKVGHAGTLDPMATGLLIVGIGRATRLLTYFVGLDKRYEACVCFGVSTDTEDADGAVVARFDASGLDFDAINRAADAFRGGYNQIPSAYSALKINGKKAYELAREGQTPELAARPIRIDSLEVGPVVDRSEGTVEVDIDVRCSSGTYIRALARDLGETLGCGAHLRALRRTEVGNFRVDDAHQLADLRELGEAGEGRTPNPALAPLVMPLAQAASTLMPAIDISEEIVARVRYGQRIAVTDLAMGDDGAAPSYALVHEGDLIGIGEIKAGSWRPSMVVPAP